MNPIIHISEMKKYPNAVYCGRPGKGQAGPFGNPVAIGKRCPICAQTHTTAGDTLPCYGFYLGDRLQKDADFRHAVYDLEGKPLACFCRSPNNPTAPCHCEILAAAIQKLHEVKTIVRKKDGPDNG